MALAPPSSESSFSSSQISDRLASFGSSSDNHDELFQQQVRNSSTGASPVGIAARAVLLFAAPLAFYRRRKQQDHSFDFCERPLSQPPLDWSVRKQIALRSARGVAYLNDRSLKIIHRDVKAANILLDEDFEAVVGDFGSAIVMGHEETHVDTTVRGTIGCIAPEYLTTGKVSAKTDVYGYGVMLLELVTGHKALACVVSGEQVVLLDRIRGLLKEKKFEMLVDTDLKGDYIDEEVEQLIQVALLCMQSSPNKRPNMSDVVWMLQGYGLAERWREFIFTQYTVNDNMDADELSGPVVDGATGATPVGLAAREALLFATPAASFWRRKQQDHSLDFPGPFWAEVYLGIKRLSMSELQVATDNFSSQNIIGRGVFGNVYKGKFADGTLVAVKRLRTKLTQRKDLQFQMEVETSSYVVHRNLRRLHGYCATPTERILVYPYMANGSVASFLRERPESRPPLDWRIRKLIALGSARGFAYLHDQCCKRIIHRDVKAANIFLDEDFEAVVGDFGLAKLMDHEYTHVTTAVRGTIGHIAPEYLSTGKASEKTDVFGYRVMLLELITGQRAFDLARLANEEDVMLLEWVKGLMTEKKLEMLVDRDLEDGYIHEEVEQLIQVALLCTQDSPNGRPSMSDVLRMLQGDDENNMN